jgi:hypothetical protein
MPNLDRRVQVLFDPEEYALLEAQARQEKRSVGSIVRDSVRSALSTTLSSRQAALARLLASAENSPAVPVGDWATVKEEFERDSLKVIV